MKTTAALTEYKFQMKVSEMGGQHGVTTKTVDAKSMQDAWVQLVKELKASGLLQYAIGLELVA